MKQSQLHLKTLKKAPKEAEAISHQLLLRGGFIRKLAAGIYNFLPLGWRVHEKIREIIREEMNKIGGQEIFLATLQPKELWQKTDRWNHMEPPLFKLKDVHKKDLCLGPTHEEIITNLASEFIQSYKDLPLYWYQIQNKFRNEIRALAGLLRVREFVMKDLYSFHESEKDLDDYYQKVIKAYEKIFKRCGLKATLKKADSGTIGGKESHEFVVNVVNNEIEAAHVFKLGTEYSKKMGLCFTDKQGKEKPVIMGCYGIGLGRLMATIVEVHHDQKGIIWPKQVAPFDVHLIGLIKADDIYRKLKDFDVLYDDRDEVSAGEKFAEADLIGIPIRIVVSEKTLKKNSVEMKKREQEKICLIKSSELCQKILALI